VDSLICFLFGKADEAGHVARGCVMAPSFQNQAAGWMIRSGALLLLLIIISSVIYPAAVGAIPPSVKKVRLVAKLLCNN